MCLIPFKIFGGSGEIRTHGGLTPSSVFKTGALNRSATLPSLEAGIIMKFVGFAKRNFKANI